MSDLVEREFRFLEIGELIEKGDEWSITGNAWLTTSRSGKRVCEEIRKYRRLIIKHYRYLEVGELIEKGDEFFNGGEWLSTTSEGTRVMCRDYYRRLIPESEINDETDVPSSIDREGVSTDSSSIQPDRDRHITIDKSNYRWDGTTDLTKQYCISVSVEEI